MQKETQTEIENIKKRLEMKVTTPECYELLWDVTVLRNVTEASWKRYKVLQSTTEHNRVLRDVTDPCGALWMPYGSITEHCKAVTEALWNIMEPLWNVIENIDFAHLN